MKRILPAVVVLLCSHVTAQTHVTSPPGFESIEGASNYFDFGAWADGRVMLLDGEMRGAARSLKGLELRLDHRRYVRGAQGRWFKQLTLDLSHCDVDKASATFSHNPVTRPTRVFSAPMALPTQVGLPAQLPAAWGGAKGRLRYPFSSAFAYDGKRDLCLDADFTGGTMYNQQPWGNNAIGYDLDGYGTGGNIWTVSYGHEGLAGCRDWNAQYGSGSYSRIYWRPFGLQNPDPKARGKHFITSATYYTAPNAPVLHVLGLSGIPDGQIPRGVRCNKLYLDLSKPVILSAVRTRPWGFASVNIGTIPDAQVAHGTQIWFQAAWADSRLGDLKLTNAITAVAPKLPRVMRRAQVTEGDPVRKTRSGFKRNYLAARLIMRFAY